MMLNHFYKTLNFYLNETINRQSISNKVIQQNVKLHNELQRLISAFNDGFGLMCLGAFIYIVGIITCEIYIIYTTYGFANSKTHKFLNCWLNICYFVPMNILIWALGWKCNKTLEEADKCRFLIETVESKNNMVFYYLKIFMNCFM